MIEKNQEFEIKITGLTHEGLGVGKIEGFAIFVANALPGEIVRIKVIKVTKSYGVGKLLQVVIASNDRIEPWCSVAKRCGGCDLQHLSYEAQMDFKANQVKESIQRIGKISAFNIQLAMGMAGGKEYRNKVVYPVRNQKGLVQIGFYSRGTHEVIAFETCGIQTKQSNVIRDMIKDFVTEYDISAYDEASGTGVLRHVMVRTAFVTGEIMVVLVVNERKFPKMKAFLERLIESVPAVCSVYLNINKERGNVILGSELKLVYGKEVIRDQLGKFWFNISPLSFYQVNRAQTEVLYEKVLEYAGLSGNEIVFDLYSGIGTISLFLSQRAKKVYGIEVVSAAVADAKVNAALNQVENVEFIEGTADDVAERLYQEGVRADVVVVDPPRKGCDQTLLETMVKMKPKRIVYVSCNPATLARDLQVLCGSGYGVVEVQPVDMFPWTKHVESICLIERKVQE